MQSFSNQQTCSLRFAIEAFIRDVIRWVILLAQMQSGKTETYLLIACELIRRKLVKNVVIFSGNTETDLRDQLKDQLKVGSKFFEKYVNMRSEEEAKTRNMTSFQEFRMLDTQIREEVTAILSKFIVIWGCELNAYSGPNLDNVFEDMLFIWEEAHHAQSLDQRPAKFLAKIGVSADGNPEHLERNNNYMMTISATPFSELSDNLRQMQGKCVVKMTPGDSYVSVKNIKESGRIVPFTKKEDGIKQALQLPKSGKNWYGIIRFQQKHEDIVKMLVESNGWKWVEYDSVSSDRKKGETTWKNMDKEPAENTVILIRGKCRMGKNLEKKHLLFVFETSKQSNTDTVLQSLLGRTCGYSEGSDSVIVYLSERIVKSGEIERYIDMWDREGVQIMPTCANNLTDKKVKSHVPIIPIAIQSTRKSNDRKDILKDVKDAFTRGERLVNKNSSAAFFEVRNKVLTFESSKLNCRFLKSSKEHHLTRAKNIHEAFEHSIPKEFGAGGCVDDTEIKIWVNKGEFDTNTIYVTSIVTREDIDAFNIPATTGREVFATRLEDETEVVGNGGMTIRLSSHTANNVTAMKTELCQNMIEVSLRTQGCDRKVASCWDDREKEFKGVLVNQDVYAQLQKGGSIYEHVKREYGLLLHTCKPSGPQPKGIASRGFIKLASISW